MRRGRGFSSFVFFFGWRRRRKEATSNASFSFLHSFLSPLFTMPPKKQQHSNGGAASSAAAAVVTTSVAAPWTLSAHDTARALGVDPSLGLDSKAEVGRRRDAVGANELSREPGTPLWRLVLAQFDDMLVKVRKQMRGYEMITKRAGEENRRASFQKRAIASNERKERSPARSASKRAIACASAPNLARKLTPLSLSSRFPLLLSTAEFNLRSSSPRPASPSSSPSSTARPPTRASLPLSSRE